MYNFNFMKDEKLIDVFDEVLVKQGDNEKIITIALTDKRLLFLDYVNTNLGLDALRIARGVSYTRYKDVFYQIRLDDIEHLIVGEYYQVVLKNEIMFEFNNAKLYELLVKNN